MTSYTETLVYDSKARDESFENYDKLIKWCKDFSFLRAAMGHAQNKKWLMEHVSIQGRTAACQSKWQFGTSQYGPW